MPKKNQQLQQKGDKKEKKIQKILQNKSKHTNNKYFSWVNALRVLSLAGSHSPPHLPRMPYNTVLISGPAVGQLWVESGPTPVWYCSQCPQLSELMHFLLWELSISLYIFHSHGICLVDHVDLICSLYSWWEVFFLHHTGFQLWFYFNLCLWVVHWDLPQGCPVRSRCGSSTAAWVSGVWAGPGTQGSWWLGQQEI